MRYILFKMTLLSLAAMVNCMNDNEFQTKDLTGMHARPLLRTLKTSDHVVNLKVVFPTSATSQDYKALQISDTKTIDELKKEITTRFEQECGDKVIELYKDWNQWELDNNAQTLAEAAIRQGTVIRVKLFAREEYRQIVQIMDVGDFSKATAKRIVELSMEGHLTGYLDLRNAKGKQKYIKFDSSAGSINYEITDYNQNPASKIDYSTY